MIQNNGMPIMANNPRIAYFDALKCLGILLVIRGHVESMGMGVNGTYVYPSSLMMYSFTMPLFFFISGFFVYKPDQIGKFDSIKKLWPKFLYLVVPALVFAIFSKIYEQGSFFDIVSEGFGKYWFTITLFEIFALYYLIVALSQSWRVISGCLVILSIVGIGYLTFFSNYEIPLLDFNHLAKYLLYFTIGVVLKMQQKICDRIMRCEVLKCMSIILYFSLIILVINHMLPNVLYHFCRDIVIRLLGTYLIVSYFYCNQNIFEKPLAINGFIKRIGQNSLAIYLLQYFFIPEITGLSRFIEKLDIFTIHVIALLYTLVITVICLAFIELLSNSSIVKKYILGKK